MQEAGVDRAITLYPEWIPAFTLLDKGGSPGHPGIENRPKPPPKNLVGKRVAFHAGAYVGGRKGKPATKEGQRALLETAVACGWNVVRIDVFADGGPVREVVLRKGDKQARIDFEELTVGAIVFTGVITGFTPPTDSPIHPWHFEGSCGWHVEQIVQLAKPIPCAGLQGFWPLSSALTPRVRP